MLNTLKKWLLKRYLARYRIPRDMTREAFRRYADRTALITPRGGLSFAELGRRVYALARGLEDLGIEKGGRAFTLLPDSREQVEARLACFESGLILTSFHTAHPRSAVLGAARTAPPDALIVDPRIGAETARALSLEHPGLTVLETGPGRNYEDLLDTAEAGPSQRPVHPRDPAALGFTSGTTGEPKALFTTHEVIVTSLKLTATNVSITPGQPDTFVLGIPLVGAGSGVVLPMLFSGSTLVIPEAYTAEAVLDAIRRHQATRTFVTPSLLIDFLDHPEADLGSLRNVIYGTAPMPAPKLEEAVRRWGPIFQQGYGMAEVLPPVSLLQMHDHGTRDRPAPREVLRSVGRVVPEVEVRIINPEGEDLPPGEVGEILIDSPTTFSGYWKSPELNRQVLRDGWYHTRDLGFLDQDGRLHVLGRRTDLIQRDGKTMYPLRVEEAAHDHPAVKEACLVTDPHGQVLTLAVSLRRTFREENRGKLIKDLSRHLREKLPAGHSPDRVAVLEELPRSYLVKVLHREVRESLPDADPQEKEKLDEHLYHLKD